MPAWRGGERAGGTGGWRVVGALYGCPPTHYCQAMTARGRLLSFGASALVILLGVLASPVIGGITGEAISIGLVSLGGIAVVALIFLEVGLSEDRERARERAAARALRRRPPPRRRRPR